MLSRCDRVRQCSARSGGGDQGLPHASAHWTVPALNRPGAVHLLSFCKKVVTPFFSSQHHRRR